MKEDFLENKLQERRASQAFREMKHIEDKIDFSSNDYLGIVKNNRLQETGAYSPALKHGSTGSRLLSGNYPLIEATERQLAEFHQAEAALIFNSGYDANLGLLSCIASREDTILYDYLSHASIRDGIRLSHATHFSFLHNDPIDLEKKICKAKGKIFVVTESVFSMDGDLAPLKAIASICSRHNALLIVDEAHATGVVGEKGEGLVQLLGLQNECFARIHTFGKACGAHGAVILGSKQLKHYLVNFCRAFIYTTALPEASVAAINAAYKLLPFMHNERAVLKKHIKTFQTAAIAYRKLISETAIQGVIIPGNENAKKLAGLLQENQMDIRPILYPTVPKGEERLRIVLHAFNTDDEMALLINTLNLMNQEQR